MSAQILDGKALAEQIRSEIKEQVAAFVAETGLTPCLAVILVGNNAASEVYVRNKQVACEKIGIKSEMYRLPETTSERELLTQIDMLNRNDAVHGILVQLPLPKQMNEQNILDAIIPEKDVDAFHSDNVGRISQGRPRFLPCTPYGIQELLIRNHIATAGKHAVIIGRSNIVGKPMALLLVQKGCGGDATVTICHSRTPDIAAMTRQADILIVAIGQAKFVTADMVKPGATVIDVGMNRTEEGLVGDVDFSAVKEIAGAITPVPGGVGPLTVTMLLLNTLTAAKNFKNCRQL
ncbi:MAG: bifunctional methylenetetrahydrofolate dehydrogenase/methenyltetrahydrofolate cyclohydrolase FolD [Planctomycetaceae bacterium]|jgi:methylenetetrahydrofolate dehydrogenase (NADP+)/methenyltetrahydrofolate cyclohydrolase|nr:bifunctional methylenetetrahydrofolate dehydrogenase/methenyltetrahydrofolate cyclohydrolase FolD [Planctomycetaceae bacterium]